MKQRKNKKQKYIGIITSLLIITFVIMILSLIFNIIGINGQKTAINNGLLESSLITVNNIFTKDGIRFLLNNVTSNLDYLKPLIILIMSVMCTSILESSGLLSHIFSKFGKLKTPIITFATVLISIIFTFFGEYSYLFLFPLVASIYRVMDRSSVVGIITVFLGITLGYGFGIFMNYDQYSLGLLTEQAAILDVDPSYKFSIFSTNYIMVIGTALLVFVLTIFIEKNIMSKYKKIEKLENQYNYSKKGLIISGILFIFLFVTLIICSLPQSFLLDDSSSNYIAKLFGNNSVMKDGLIYILLLFLMLIGTIYGKITKNFKDDVKANIGLSKNFDNFGYIFVIMFFSVQLISILNYTNIGTILITGLTNLLSFMDFSGLFLIVTFIIVTIITTVFVPSLIDKWVLMSPIIVPLFMRANITPGFCQFLYVTSNSIGRSITPFFIYFLIMIGFVQKYESEDVNTTIGSTLKLILPTILWTVGIMLVFILLWYISGLPVGIGGYPTL